MKAQQKPIWLLIGDWSIPRAAPFLADLGAQRFRIFETINSAFIAVETESLFVEFVLVLQTFPDEYPAPQIEQLIGAIPLAHWMVLVGEWCDSLGRTEQHWPIGWCVPLRDAQARLTLEKQRLRDRLQPLPPTASRDEAFSTASLPNSRPINKLIQDCYVEGDDSTTNIALSEQLQAIDVRPQLSCCNGLNVVAITSPTDSTGRRVQSIRSEHPTSLIWIATDLVTPEQTSLLRASGADAVVSALRFHEAIGSLP